MLIPGTRKWDIKLVREVFTEVDLQRILATPLPPLGVEDRLIWHFSRDGTYIVKSAYQLAAKLTIEEEHSVPGNLPYLWKVKAPPKAKMVVWRACRECLPTKSNLLKRNINLVESVLLAMLTLRMIGIYSLNAPLLENAGEWQVLNL